MSKALSTEQDSLSRRASLVPINLVKLTDYAESKTWYLSDRVLSYDYDGDGAVDFLPLLSRIGSHTRGMTHLPSLGAGVGVSEWEVTLSNETWEDERFAETLDSETLEGASIEWAQLLINESPTGYPMDLTDYATTDKVVFYRGRIRQVGPITESGITLRASVDLPEMDWTYNAEAAASVVDLGVRVPFPYGMAKKIPCVAWEVGVASELATDITDSATTIYLKDASAFPSGTYYARIGMEEIQYTGISGNALTGVTRGYGATDAFAHRKGERVVEAITETYIAGENDPTAVDAVYVANPSRPDELMKLTESAHYTVTLEDTSTITGKTIALITVSRTQYLSIMEEARIGDVVEQPEPDSGTPTGVTDEAAISYTNYGVADPDNVIDNDSGTQGQFVGSDAIRVEFTPPAGPITSGLTAEVLIGASGLHASNPIYVGSESGLADIATLTSVSNTSGNWYSYSQASGLNSNYFWLWSNGLSVSSYISGVRRDYTYTAGGYAPEVTVRADTFPLKLYADVQGPCIATELNWEQQHDFDEVSGWTNADEVTDEKYEGTGSIRLTQTVNPWGTGNADVSNWEQSTDWTYDYGTGGSVNLDSSVYVDGSDSIRFDSPDASGAQYWNCDAISPYTDDSDEDYEFYVRWSGAFGTPGPSEYPRFVVYFGDNATSNYSGSGVFYLVSAPNSSDFLLNVDTWYRVRVKGAGTGDDMAVRIYPLGYNSGTLSVWIDGLEVVTEPSSPTAVEAYRSGLSSADWESDNSDLYRWHWRWLWAGPKINSVTPIANSIELWFSDDATPSPRPSAYMLLSQESISGYDQETWTQKEQTGAETGAPDMTDINTMGIKLDTTMPPGYRVIEEYPSTSNYVVQIWVDDLQTQKYSAASGWVATPGDTLEHPADIFRHFVEYVADGVVDETSVVEAQTNLGSNKLAFDARAFGFTWPEIAARIGYESRANVVGLETPTGTQWAFLTADASYGFNTSSLSVSVWDPGGFALVGRGLEQDLFTRYAFFYAHNASMAGSDKAFGGFLRVCPSDNDVSSKVTTSELTSGETSFGAHEAPPIEYLGIHEQTTAIDVAGYTVHELLRRAKMFAIRGVPWYDDEAYTLELGDIRNVTPPWSSTPVKCRVIEIIKDATEQLELRLVEVE